MSAEEDKRPAGEEDGDDGHDDDDSGVPDVSLSDAYQTMEEDEDALFKVYANYLTEPEPQLVFVDQAGRLTASKRAFFLPSLASNFISFARIFAFEFFLLCFPLFSCVSGFAGKVCFRDWIALFARKVHFFAVRRRNVTPVLV